MMFFGDQWGDDADRVKVPKAWRRTVQRYSQEVMTSTALSR